MINGVHHYEEGTDVKLTALNNRILTFTNWVDDTTSQEREVKMDSEKSLTANCGITKADLPNNVQEDIAELAKAQGMTHADTIASLQRQYDGYHFTWPSPDIFNPYSILKLFQRQAAGVILAWVGHAHLSHRDDAQVWRVAF